MFVPGFLVMGWGAAGSSRNGGSEKGFHLFSSRVLLQGQSLLSCYYFDLNPMLKMTSAKKPEKIEMLYGSVANC